MIKQLFRIGIIVCSLCRTVQAQEPVTAYMPTPWTSRVDKTLPLNDYPRPSMVRDNWRNLNGRWQYAIREKQMGIPAEWDGEIVVPFPVESYLSEVQQRISDKKRIWYRRMVQVDRLPKNKRTLLHIGASDWETTLFINGVAVLSHRGGYTPISADITAYLKTGNNSIVISVADPTDAGEQARGKQVSRPGGIYYTSVTGIWQTVWLEQVPVTYIRSYKVITDIDQQQLTIRPETAQRQPGDRYVLSVFDQGRLLVKKEYATDGPLVAAVPSVVLWSPEQPHLYDFRLAITRLGDTVDQVSGYFGMRKVEVKKDEKGISRLFLNNKPLFMYGPLDQGYWPDGIYTAPTDEALLSDIERMKAMGFNMVRKHVKVEPERWYYYCDKLGLMVWQDMPSGYQEIVPVKDHDHSVEGSWLAEQYKDLTRNKTSEEAFRQEWKAIINTLENHPAIVVWVPFNESWGQFKTNEILRWTKQLDPSRVVDGPSGWIDRGGGEMRDYHLYGNRLQKRFPVEKDRALVIGELGGLGFTDPEHSMKKEVWSYGSFKSTAALWDAYKELVLRIKELKKAGFSAAIYTQLTDVETEGNGIITYDRMRLKMSAGQLKELHQLLYEQ